MQELNQHREFLTGGVPASNHLSKDSQSESNATEIGNGFDYNFAKKVFQKPPGAQFTFDELVKIEESGWQENTEQFDKKVMFIKEMKNGNGQIKS